MRELVRRHAAGKSHAPQRGVAIVGALVVVAAASVAAATILERQALLAETLTGERDRIQARWLLRGGLDWSRIILLNDARRNPVTRNGAVWSQPIMGLEVSTPGEERKAYFSGQIEDEQGKFNLWILAVNGQVQIRELAALETLLSGLDVPAGLSGAIAQRVAESQGRSSGTNTVPALRTLGDLMVIEDMTPAIIDILSPYLSILPQKTSINANTASAEVLSAVVPGLNLGEARALVEERGRGIWFNSRADFFNRLANPEIRPGDQIGVNSEWFKVTGQVTLDLTVTDLQALLHRQGNQPPSISWTIN